MPDPVISDTSALILLQNIGELALLKNIYGNIIVTPEVAEEFSDTLPEWVTLHKVRDGKYQEFLETQLDPGEASVLALAKEFESPLILLDDLKARKIAKKLKIRFTGTLGILYKAKKAGIITEVKPFTDKLIKKNFRISNKILKEFLRLNKE